MKMTKKMKKGMGTTPGQGALKTALTTMSDSAAGVRTISVGRNSSKGFAKKVGMK